MTITEESQATQALDSLRERSPEAETTRLLALLIERGSAGVTDKDFEFQVSRRVSEINDPGKGINVPVMKRRDGRAPWVWSLREYLTDYQVRSQGWKRCGQKRKPQISAGRTKGYDTLAQDYRRRAAKETGNYSLWLRTRAKVMEQSKMLKSVTPMIFHSETPQLEVNEMMDELVQLSIHLDQAINGVRARVGDEAMRERIAQLRDNRGREPEEAAMFNARADKLERALELSY